MDKNHPSSHEDCKLYLPDHTFKGGITCITPSQVDLDQNVNNVTTKKKRMTGNVSCPRSPDQTLPEVVVTNSSSTIEYSHGIRPSDEITVSNITTDKETSSSVTKRNTNDHNHDVAKVASDNDSINESDKEEPALDEPDFWDGISQYSVRMRQDARYYFQHPYARLVVAYLVTFCNFLIYAEDPVAHSEAECNIIFVGNVYSFIVTKYSPDGWVALKVVLWLTGIVVGMVLGKLVVHKLFLQRVCKLQMFQEDLGSFMVMFITTLLSLFTLSWIYNALLLAGGLSTEFYAINGFMGMRNSMFMKAAACGTWLGDFFTAWMVTDIMLQEKFYPQWAIGARIWWRKGRNRIILFWIAAATSTIIVVLVISTDWVKWDSLNANFLPTNELSRAFLASFILVMDLLIVMQDWDFPHFINHFDIKLPGLNTADLKIQLPKCFKRLHKYTIHITGKWFNYGIIFLVMILDLNMWKNQIFYAPGDFLQYTDDAGHIYSLRTDTYLNKPINATQLSFNWRNSTINPFTNQTLVQEDVKMNSRYLGIHLGIKAIAFIPALVGFVTFIALIFVYGRVKPTMKDPYIGRITKTPKTVKNTASMFTVVRMKLFGRHLKTSNMNDAVNTVKAGNKQGYAMNDDSPVSI